MHKYETQRYNKCKLMLLKLTWEEKASNLCAAIEINKVVYCASKTKKKKNRDIATKGEAGKGD